VKAGPYLNIPEEGDGNSVSPYLSVLVTEEIAEAVRLMSL
jgi:hypothetical protein